MSGSNLSDAFCARAAAPGSEGPEPLCLCVHGLPPTGAALPVAQRTRRGRWQMLAVLLVCAAPVLASYFTYYVVRPEGRRNFGTLIESQPVVPAEEWARTLDGEAVPLASLKGQWLLISVAGGRCDAACEAHLYLQRQLRESLGREKDRVDWVWLVNDQEPLPQALAPALAQAGVLRVEASTLAAWLRPAAGQRLEDHLYVVDPLGHWMMRMPASLDRSSAVRARRDLERLLRASASWDSPGRSLPAGP